MQIFKIGEFIILKGNKTAEPKYREILSKLIISNFGKSLYTTDIITNILYFCRDYYISEFEQILNSEKSYSFYKEIVWMHEQSTNLRSSQQFKSLSGEIDKSYITEYRRILKMTIEHGCCIEMLSGEKNDSKFKARIYPIINDLLFLGKMLLDVSESIAEQEMIEDATEISFDKNNLYMISRRHHYKFIFNYLNQKHQNENPEYIIDENGKVDFKKAIHQGFNIDYDKVLQTIFLVKDHFKLKEEDCISAKQNGFLQDIEKYSGTPIASIKKLLSGLTLTKDNKMILSERLKKPSSLNKYLFRPFLLWTINQKKYYVFGTASLFEVEESLYLNAIPWAKIPIEWEDVVSFKKYADKKSNIHDKWLDNNVENSIKTTGLIYQRTVKKLITKEKAYNLEIKDLGEIDFIIVSPYLNKVFIAECKHLIGRYDMVNQKEDFDHFTKDGKKICYDRRLNFKIEWMTKHKAILEKHLQLRFDTVPLSV